MNIKKALIVGGSNGIGLAIANCLSEDGCRVTVVDRAPLDGNATDGIAFEQFDLTSKDYSVFDKYHDVDILMITAGFGHLALFQDIPEEEINRYFEVNTIPVIRIIKRFYDRLQSDSVFRVGVMVSIAGYMSSPFFSVYSATKAALRTFIESVNVELEKGGSGNRILNVSPGSIKGTKFDGNSANTLQLTMPLAREIISHLEQGDDLFIPKYDEVFKTVLERYHNDFREEGRHSYDYKVASGRIKK